MHKIYFVEEEDMKNIANICVVLILSVVILGPVFGGGRGDQSGGAGEEKTITWLTQGAGTNPGAWEQVAKPILQRYYELTGVTVKGEFLAFADLFQVIEVKIGSGSRDYDVVTVDGPMVAGYINRGYLAPMDEYFTPAEKAQYIQSSLDAGTWDGKFYCPPMKTSSQLLWYNKDLLAQAGVTLRPSDVNNRLTYEEVVEYAKQTLAKVDPNHANGIAGLMFEQVSRTYQMCMIPNSLGEKAIGSDGFTVDGVINNAGWIKAMTWYQNLYKDQLSVRGYNGDEVTPLFNSGKVVFLIGGTWMPSRAPDVNKGFVPVPAFKGFESKIATPTGSWHYGINKASAKKAQAADFIKFMTLGEGREMWLKAITDVPATKAAIDEIQNDPNADPIMKIAAYEAANTAVPRALTPGYPEYSTILDAAFEDIRNGSDVKGALDNAVREINSALAKYK
jgi:ABC-type glycerol-3-phosphate transport system substrate-binding protein